MANTCPYGYSMGDDGLCHYSGWNSWGRWIVAAVFFLFAALFLLLWLRRLRFSRRLARQQQQQQWGGGAPAPTPLQTMPPQYGYAPQYNGNSPYGAQYPPPPPPPPFYATKPGVEEGVATPANVYPRNPVDDDYEPPSGPPPSGKKF